ncbi:hypothetical protein [Paraburkholderia sp. DGU8]|uniref:hypothetical protein n=1 Tax=Paraburkholderia sp. DGU8 TaxID=3161997 RepID=UPI0034657964
MNIVDIARASGLIVILDGKIGLEEYQSICGSVSALERFAEAVRQGDSAAPRSPAPDLSRRPRLRFIGGLGISGGRAALARRVSHNARRTLA